MVALARGFRLATFERRSPDHPWTEREALFFQTAAFLLCHEDRDSATTAAVAVAAEAQAVALLVVVVVVAESLRSHRSRPWTERRHFQLEHCPESLSSVADFVSFSGVIAIATVTRSLDHHRMWWKLRNCCALAQEGDSISYQASSLASGSAVAQTYWATSGEI